MPRVHADKELMRKTASLVKEQVKVGQIADPLPIYAINEQTLEALKKDPKSEKAKAVNLTRSIRVFVDDNQSRSPFLLGIGERVEAINELYDNRQIDTIEALKQLEELVRQVNLAKKEQTEKQLDTRTFSIYWVLKTYTTYGVDKLLNIPILHVHGHLGVLPSKGGNFPYEPTDDNSHIQNISRNLRLTDEEADNQVIGQAQILIQKAETIRFLGFGFHESNLKKLSFDANAANCNDITGTAVGLTETERESKGRKHPKLKYLDGRGRTIVSLFREANPL